MRLGFEVRADGVHVWVDAPYHKDPAPIDSPGPTMGLWLYEVVEIFIAGDEERYLELEMGPHGHYLMLVLDGVRQVVGQPVVQDYTAQIVDGRWTGQARFAVGYLPSEPWTLNAYSIHGVGEQRVHQAMIPVPGDQPDFHRLDVFARAEDYRQGSSSE
ncbi:MAG: hypothetical protein CMH54_12120 [Myxococcales bacterium]|nr:hypothetical protein [Myxococcales bacterium]